LSQQTKNSDMYYCHNYPSKKPSLTEVLGELLPLYDLNLYEELGRNAQLSGNKGLANEWYVKGLSMARELQNSQKINLFKQLIIQNIQP
jgi:hypothetical protein